MRGDLGNLPPDQESVKQSIQLLTLRQLIGCSHLRSIQTVNHSLYCKEGIRY